MIRITMACGAAIIALSATVLAQAAAPSGDSPNIEGVWSRGDGNAKVRIGACDSKLCATNIWIKDGDTDEHVGDVLEMTMKPRDDGGLTGEAYDKRRDLHYSMDITVKGAEMTTKGCVVGGLICKSSNWTRGG